MQLKFVSAIALALVLGACGQSAAPGLAPARALSPFGAHQQIAEPQPEPPAEEPVAPVKPRVYTLEDMNVGKRVQRQLAKAGITNSAQLLEAARRDGDRAKLVEATGVPGEKLLELVHMADLMRVRGVGPTQSRLLISVGVTTVKDLARRNPLFLRTSLEATNGNDRVSERTPGLEVVSAWVEQARALDRVISY